MTWVENPNGGSSKQYDLLSIKKKGLDKQWKTGNLHVQVVDLI